MCCRERPLSLLLCHPPLTYYPRHFALRTSAYPLDGGRIYAASLILVFKITASTAARVTAITAMLISSCMIIWALVNLLSGTGGSLVLLGALGAFVFHQSYQLFAATQRNDLDNHPIFGRDCYQHPSGSGTNSGGNEAGIATVPAQTNNAVLA